jgi:pantetheine-phosphate adenylyltransferase
MPKKTTDAATRKIAVFPGQFDPITLGHLDIIQRGSVLFDELIVAVGVNPDKRELFTHEHRLEMIDELLKQNELTNVRAALYTGLTADFVKASKATAILRGIRDVSDLRYEFQLALANRAVGGVETIFIMTGERYALTSSSLIRQVVQLGGDVDQLRSVCPTHVVRALKQYQKTHGKLTGPDTPVG